MQKSYAHTTGVTAAVLAALCWGSATVMSKGALGGFAPVSLLVLQLAASVALLWLLVWFQPPKRLAPRDIAPFAWLGLLEPGLAYLLGLTGLTDTDAGSATLIQASESIMIVAVSAILFRERPSARFMVLSVLAVGGLFVALGIVGNGATGGGLVGEFLIFAGTAAAAVYVVISGRFATQANPIYIVAWQQSVALIFALLLLPMEWVLRPQSLALPSTISIWLLACISGVVQYALAFSLYMAALRTISANIAGSFLSLTPLFGLVGAFVFLHEELSAIQLMGAAVTIIAVMLINLTGDK